VSRSIPNTWTFEIAFGDKLPYFVCVVNSCVSDRANKEVRHGGVFETIFWFSCSEYVDVSRQDM